MRRGLGGVQGAAWPHIHLLPLLCCGTPTREFNFVKQQQTAARLLKATGGGAKQQQAQQTGGADGRPPNYTWWAVCALVLQARAALLGGKCARPCA